MTVDVAHGAVAVVAVPAAEAAAPRTVTPREVVAGATRRAARPAILTHTILANQSQIRWLRLVKHDYNTDNR